MIGRNIRYYRLVKKMSQEELAIAIGSSKMAISNYEAGKRNPNYDTCRKLADVLEISLSMLLARADTCLEIRHGAFRKQSAVTKTQQQIILEHIDRYLTRLYEAASFIGNFSLPPVPSFERKSFQDDYDSAAQYLRDILNISSSGPIGNITDILENKGFIICPVNYPAHSFSGNSGTVNSRPYIAVNITMPAERQRFTLIHELAHLVFDQNNERIIDSIAGAFLFPRIDAVRELGAKRTDIRCDLRNIQREYGISMPAIVMRAYQTGIITKNIYEITMKWMSANGLRSNDISGIIPEKSRLLEQLVSHAVAEDEITVSKAAELLEMPLLEVRRLCYSGI